MYHPLHKIIDWFSVLQSKRSFSLSRIAYSCSIYIWYDWALQEFSKGSDHKSHVATLLVHPFLFSCFNAFQCILLELTLGVVKKHLSAENCILPTTRWSREMHTDLVCRPSLYLNIPILEDKNAYDMVFFILNLFIKHAFVKSTGPSSFVCWTPQNLKFFGWRPTNTKSAPIRKDRFWTFFECLSECVHQWSPKPGRLWLSLLFKCCEISKSCWKQTMLAPKLGCTIL